jgi:uncharacterized protein YlxW (UPF0749 family)
MPDNTQTGLDGYKSPVRKLAAFFRKSRDQWKVKHNEKKADVKRLKDNVRYLRTRNAELKSKVRNLEHELNQIKGREKEMTEEIRELKKNQ